MKIIIFSVFTLFKLHFPEADLLVLLFSCLILFIAAEPILMTSKIKIISE